MIAGCKIRWPDWEVFLQLAGLTAGPPSWRLGAGDVYWMEIVRTCWARTNAATCLI